MGARLWIPPLVINFELPSLSSNCFVLFNFSSTSFYQATLKVIQFVKEDSNFGSKAFLVICYFGHRFCTRCLSWRNPLHGDDKNPMILALFLRRPPKSSKSSTERLNPIYTCQKNRHGQIFGTVPLLPVPRLPPGDSLGTPKILSTGATIHLGPIRLHVKNWECRTLKSSAPCQKFGVACRLF